MNKVRNHWGGGGIYDTAMAAIIAHWKAYGLSEPVLLQIASDLIGWVPPSP